MWSRPTSCMFTSLSTFFKFLASFNYTTTAIFTAHLRNHVKLLHQHQEHCRCVFLHIFKNISISLLRHFSGPLIQSMLLCKHVVIQVHCLSIVSTFLCAMSGRHYMEDTSRCRHCYPATNETRLSRWAKTKNNRLSDRTSTTQGPAPHTL